MFSGDGNCHLDMPKKSCGVRLEEEIVKRLETVAKVDRRTLANVIELCVAEYLPQLEAEMLQKKDPRQIALTPAGSHLELNDAPRRVKTKDLLTRKEKN